MQEEDVQWADALTMRDAKAVASAKDFILIDGGGSLVTFSETSLSTLLVL